MAAQRVFDITELLEHIILSLGGYYDIWIARTICKRWRAVFESSNAVKRLTFHAPGDPFKTGTPVASQHCVGLEDYEFISTYMKRAQAIGCEHFTYHPRDLASKRRGLGILSGFPKDSAFCRSMYLTQPPQLTSLLCVDDCVGDVACAANETIGSMIDKLEAHGGCGTYPELNIPPEETG